MDALVQLQRLAPRGHEIQMIILWLERKGQGKEEWSGVRIAPGNVLAHDGFSLTMALEWMASR